MAKIQEISECCICTDRFKDPRILSCIHTFCLDCLEKTALQRKLKPEDSMQCPICRKRFVIPKEGMPALQKNFFMEHLVELLKSSEQTSNAILCDKCKNHEVKGSNDIPKAVHVCIQCNENICNRCYEDHKRFTELQNHQFIEIGSPLKEELLKKFTQQYCDQHKKKALEMFCADCQQVICLVCFAQKHKFHNCSDIAEVAEKLRKQISCDLDKMKNCVREASVKILEAAAMQEAFQRKIKDTEKAIVERGNKLKELVDKHTKSLLDELTVIKQQESKQLASHKEERETHKMVVESFERYCMELQSKGSDAEICRSAKDLHLRAEELKEDHKKEICQRFFSLNVFFELPNPDSFLEKHNMLGKIRETRVHESDIGKAHMANISISDVITLRSSGELVIPTSDIVNGVTKLHDKIYFLCQQDILIHVFYDQAPFKKQDQIKLKLPEYTVDIGHCKKSKCLYVLVLSGHCIWKVTPDDHRVTEWLQASNYIEPHLSMTSEDHLLIFNCDKWSCLQLLETYGSDAKLIRRVSILPCISRPQNVIQKPNGDIIVSHMLETNVGGGWAISQLSSDGQTVLNQFRPRDKSDTLSVYCHMVLDADNDRLFVADRGKDRVVLFDANSLNLIQILLTKDRNRISDLSKLCYDQKRKQLIVAHTKDKVDIYKVEGKKTGFW